MDDMGTFAVVTQQAEFRAQVRAALAGLDPVDREISELNLRHGFYGADLADILGAPRSQVHTRASRARLRFERSLGPLLLAGLEREYCPELAAILDDQGGNPSLRWRVRRHIGRCEVCGVRKRSGLNPAILLGVLPVFSLPADLRRQTLDLISDQSSTAVVNRARAQRVPGSRHPGTAHDAVGAWTAGHCHGGSGHGCRGPGSAGRRHVLRSGVRSRSGSRRRWAGSRRWLGRRDPVALRHCPRSPPQQWHVDPCPRPRLDSFRPCRGWMSPPARAEAQALGSGVNPAADIRVADVVLGR